MFANRNYFDYNSYKKDGIWANDIDYHLCEKNLKRIVNSWFLSINLKNERMKFWNLHKFTL